VSSTLAGTPPAAAAAAAAAEPPLPAAVRHPPHAWRCRWYAWCNETQLRRSLPHAPGHVTWRVKPR